LATDTETAAAISSHNSSTTTVHGITDTAALATSTSLSSAISTHASAADPHTVYLKESEYVAAGKNKIINGDFSINQRAFTSLVDSNSYGFDRWRTGFAVSGSSTLTYSAQTFTPGTAPVAGYEAVNFARLLTASQSLATDRCQLIQNIEDVRTFAGQTVTVSFWAKANSGTPSLAVEMTQNFGSGGSPSTRVDSILDATPKRTISTSWERYSWTINIPSISGKTFGTSINSSVLQLVVWLSAGSDFNSRNGTLGLQNNTFDIWGVQVEQSSTATPFTTATGTIQGELAACQRYYQRFTAGSANNYMASGGIAGSSTDLYMPVKLTTTMRIAPTAIDYTGLRWQIISNSGTISSAVISDANPNICLIRCTSTGLTSTTQSYMLMTAANTDYLGFSAEL
jgi:hypothetical protein